VPRSGSENVHRLSITSLRIADINYLFTTKLRRRPFRRNCRMQRQPVGKTTKPRRRDRGIAMQRRRLCFAALVGLTLTSAPFAQGAPLRGEPAKAGYYFVDFRARSGGVFGHTYVVYGKIDGRGRILNAHATGFYPRGQISQSVLSVALPMPSYVGLEPSDRGRPPSAIYRRYLHADAYARLVTTVESMRERRRPWHLLFYNCNAFTARIARSIGLRTPPTLELPNSFVHGLYAMNRAVGAPPARRPAAYAKRWRPAR
jgi:hypothetical protein